MNTQRQHPLEAQRLLAKQAGFTVPTAPRQGNIPKWFERRMKRAGYRVNRYTVPDALDSSWCDHWGSGFNNHSRPIFIAEPYSLTNDGLIALLAFVRRCGLIVEIHAMAYHNSGACVRIEISEPGAVTCLKHASCREQENPGALALETDTNHVHA